MRTLLLLLFVLKESGRKYLRQMAQIVRNMVIQF